MGYGFSYLFVIVAIITIALFLFRSPLSYIFIAYIIAFDLKLLHSDNFFDYMIDAILFLISLGIVISNVLKFSFKKSQDRANDKLS